MKKVTLILLGISLSLSATSSAQQPTITTIDPPTIATPGRYAMGKVAPVGMEVLITAGQVGSDKDGVYARSIEEQADLAFKNLYEVVKAAGMGPEDIMKINLFYTEREYIGVIMNARNKHFGADFRPAQTALVVKSLASDQILVEVEAIAARVP